MKVKILVEFDVPGVENERTAKAAARQAASHWLCFSADEDGADIACKVFGVGGEYVVRLGDDHE